MQAAPKAIGQVPYSPRFPQGKPLHPAQPLPRPKAKARARGSFFSFLMVASICLTPLALLQLSLQAYLTQTSYRAVRLRAAIEEQQAAQERMKVEMTALNAPERVQRLAIDKLSMTYPSEISFVSLPDDGISRTSYASLPAKEVAR